MPVLEVWNARDVIVFKRSMAAGYAGVQNPLFFRDNSRMLFGDAKQRIDEILVCSDVIEATFSGRTTPPTELSWRVGGSESGTVAGLYM